MGRNIPYGDFFFDDEGRVKSRDFLGNCVTIHFLQTVVKEALRAHLHIANNLPKSTRRTLNEYSTKKYPSSRILNI